MIYPWGDERRFNSYKRFLSHKFGTRVQKLTIDAGFTCPNRDGTVGVGGCIFCTDTGSGDFAQEAELPIREQIKYAKADGLH